MCGSLRCAPADDRVLSASRLGCAPGRGAHRSGAADGCRGVYCGGVCRSPRRLRFTPLGPDHAVSLAAAPSGLGHPSGLGLRPRQFPFRLGHPSNLGLCSRRPPCSLGHPSNLGLSPAISLQPGTYLRFGAASQDTFPPFGDIPYGWGLSCAAPRQGSPKMAGKSQNGGDSAAKACRPAPLQATTIPRRYSREHRRPSPAAVPDQAWSQPVPAGPTAPAPAPSPSSPASPAQPSPQPSPRHPTSASAFPAPGPRPAAS